MYRKSNRMLASHPQTTPLDLHEKNLGRYDSLVVLREGAGQALDQAWPARSSYRSILCRQFVLYVSVESIDICSCELSGGHLLRKKYIQFVKGAIFRLR